MEAGRSLITAPVNKNSQFTNSDAFIRTCLSVHQRQRVLGGETLDGALKFMCE